MSGCFPSGGKASIGDYQEQEMHLLRSDCHIEGMKKATSKSVLNGNGKILERRSGFDLPIQARSSTELARKFRQIKQGKADVLHKSLRGNTTNKEQEVATIISGEVAGVTIKKTRARSLEEREAVLINEGLNGKVKRNKRTMCRGNLRSKEKRDPTLAAIFIETRKGNKGKELDFETNNAISQLQDIIMNTEEGYAETFEAVFGKEHSGSMRCSLFTSPGEVKVRNSQPQKSSFPYPTDDDDVEEEADDQVVPDGVEEVECKNSTWTFV
ncbi:hypothetical protein KSP40_PGU011004 [Platanthera guangdongensis]|uniref:Uncharacterized protein n=1 Tax=Platanthera guangdongensis TaxID=2320717 RepID=A0ABR2M394_9ASPA